MPKITTYISKGIEEQWKAASREEREELGDKIRSLLRNRLPHAPQRPQGAAERPKPAKRVSGAKRKK